MARAKSHGAAAANSRNKGAASNDRQEEGIGLLAPGSTEHIQDGGDIGEEAEEEGIIVHPGESDAHDGTDADVLRTPRTPNRVRFDLRPTFVNGSPAAPPFDSNSEHHGHGRARESFDLDDDDPLSSHDYDSRNRGHQRIPLLTDIEAPSVSLTTDPSSDRDPISSINRENRRPKSSLPSAFMNMANSIIGAGIIGQPYAFRQAGLLAGCVLLVALTFVVDWTICLIVINSKLSGATSFQGTVEKCFGRKGLIAVSLAQWIFAFGGMVAFGVIVGDSIPHVLTAVWPGLREMWGLGLLADRRWVIVGFTLGVSYPLALYRDIAKVSFLFFFPEI